MSRKQFVQNSDGLAPPHTDGLGAETESQVYAICPWAAVVIDAEFGWWAFEDVRDAETWRNQALA